MKVARMMNAILNTSDGAKAAMTAPHTTPSTAGTAQMRMMPGITRPFSRCARHDDRAAAHTEQSSEQPSDDAGDDDGSSKPEQFGERNP
jgi:hypothetical protein